MEKANYTAICIPALYRSLDQIQNDPLANSLEIDLTTPWEIGLGSS